jgi:hypothetical protein
VVIDSEKSVSSLSLICSVDTVVVVLGISSVIDDVVAAICFCFGGDVGVGVSVGVGGVSG